MVVSPNTVVVVGPTVVVKDSVVVVGNPEVVVEEVVVGQFVLKQSFEFVVHELEHGSKYFIPD